MAPTGLPARRNARSSECARAARLTPRRTRCRVPPLRGGRRAAFGPGPGPASRCASAPRRPPRPPPTGPQKRRPFSSPPALPPTALKSPQSLRELGSPLSVGGFPTAPFLPSPSPPSPLLRPPRFVRERALLIAPPHRLHRFIQPIQV